MTHLTCLQLCVQRFSLYIFKLLFFGLAFFFKIWYDSLFECSLRTVKSTFTYTIIRWVQETAGYSGRTLLWSNCTHTSLLYSGFIIVVYTWLLQRDMSVQLKMFQFTDIQTQKSVAYKTKMKDMTASRGKKMHNTWWHHCHTKWITNTICQQYVQHSPEEHWSSLLWVLASARHSSLL